MLFVIVADVRTGSTLLHTSLNAHSRLRVFGELFHPQTLPDNVPPDVSRDELSGRELIDAVRDAGTNLCAVGFRAMTFLPMPTHPQWADAWNALHDADDLRAIYLTRRDRLAQYASALVAHETGAYHPSPGDAVLREENRPTLTIPPQEFTSWVRERDELMALRRERLRDKPALNLEYETLISDWQSELARVQAFLGVHVETLKPLKEKQECRPLSQVVRNYDELRALQL